MPTIDSAALVDMMDKRIRGAVPADIPDGYPPSTFGIDAHLDEQAIVALGRFERDVALALVVAQMNYAIAELADVLSERTREPYGGFVTIDADVLRVRFGRVHRAQPDAGYLAPELESIPIAGFLVGR